MAPLDPPFRQTSIPDLDALYDREFFKEWGATNIKYVETARAITNLIYSFFNPVRMVDIGSGPGIYTSLFRELGVEVIAIDGVVPPPEFSLAPPDIISDFREPMENKSGLYDMTFCFEVIEHIPPESSGIFLSNLAKFSDLLLLSYAPPHQGGTGHFNEQPKRHWIGRLAEHGFIYDREQTGLILEHFKNNKTPYMWMTENICVFRRAKKT